MDKRYSREVVIRVKTRELVFQRPKDGIYERRADVHDSGRQWEIARDIKGIEQRGRDVRPPCGTRKPEQGRFAFIREDAR
jgi:hypothetical protein